MSVDNDLTQLQAASDIPKGAFVIHYGISFVLESINDGPRTIGIAARDIKAGDTVTYDSSGDTADIALVPKPRKRRNRNG